jgi:hypothetical protein
MGANSTQALAILVFLLGFVGIAGSMAGGGFLYAILGLALIAVSVYLFLKCKPWEHQSS